MARLIVIVGGLPGDPDRNQLLAQLHERSGNHVFWEWVRADADSHYRPPQKYLNGLLTKLQKERKKLHEARNAKRNREGERDGIVLLPLLHGQVEYQIRSACGEENEPTLAPRTLAGPEDFVEWVFSADANLIPRREWFGNARQAALIAILCKLVKDKSWNKDKQGHQWTIHEHLMGDSPVGRPDFPSICREAQQMLGLLETTLLIRKGGTKGTPREWCIQSRYVPMVKRIISTLSFGPLNEEHALDGLRNYVADGDGHFRLDEEIVTEIVRAICRGGH